MPLEVPGHAFLSYVREDAREVNKVQTRLEAAGIRVWRDTRDLWPGEDWRQKIREAVTADALAFIAFISEASCVRTRSYQNEELLLAIEELRLRPPGRPWLIPVRLDDCSMPSCDLGGGRTLDSLQRVDLFGDDWEVRVERLVAAVLRIVGVADIEETRRGRWASTWQRIDDEVLRRWSDLRPPAVLWIRALGQNLRVYGTDARRATVHIEEEANPEGPGDIVMISVNDARVGNSVISVADSVLWHLNR